MQAITRSTDFFLVAFCSFASYPVVAFLLFCSSVMATATASLSFLFQPVPLFTFLYIIVLNVFK